MSSLAAIEAFVRAAELGSVSRAAAALRLTPSAVSRRISRLEEELGVRLFHRAARALRLTDDGRGFLERCHNILDELRAAKATAARVRDRPEGRLRVEAPTVLGRMVLVPALPGFMAEHPRVEVELTLRDAIVDPASEGADVTLRMGALRDSGLVARRIGTMRFVVCASPGYVARHGRPAGPEQLARHRCIGFVREARTVPWRLRAGEVIVEHPPGGVLDVNDGEALRSLALAGVGLIWVPDFMVTAELASGALVSLLDEHAVEERPIHVLYAQPRYLLPRVRAFVDFVAALFPRAATDRPAPRPDRGARTARR
jgi:DNA-binding transcriptional LysR family regulator